MKHDDRVEAMTGPLKWDFMNASKEHGFAFSISRTLKIHDILLLRMADWVWEPLGLKPRPDKGCGTVDWKRQSDEDCASGLKSAGCANAAC